MMTLDHIAVIAPDLQLGITYLRNVLGVTATPGGQHLQMGTHNALIRLGDDMFLEIIARDPTLPGPADGPACWFGLGDATATTRHWHAGRRLRGMVARTDDLPSALGATPHDLGKPMRVTRGARAWTFGVRADGQLPLDGALPHVMDWGVQGPAGPTLPDQGCRLLKLILETPEPAGLHVNFDEQLKLERAPEIRRGAVTKLMAVIESPTGVHLLT